MGTWELLGVLLMPVTYGFVGWMTNCAALHMMLYPIEYRGVRPLGWQGIVPRRATPLALTVVQMLERHVVGLGELMGSLRPSRLARFYRPLLEQTVPSVFPEAPQALSAATDTLDRRLGVLESGAAKALNFKGLVIRGLTGPNVSFLVRVFATVGAKEFALIRKSGWLFGAIFGLVQVGLWLVWPMWWTLPVLGALVGAGTNAIALWLVFRPLRERRILGMSVQGLFLRRQAEVAEQYAALLAERVLSPDAIATELLHRPIARRAADAAGAPEKAAPLQTRLEEDAENLHRLMGRGMKVQQLISDRLKAMSPETFEPILRNAFRQDERLLVIVGGVLGAFVGLLQGLFMLLLA